MKSTRPVSVWGIEFDALVEETKTMNATIPVYPVESGFPVSDTITNDPIQVQMTLFLTNTPVTWLYRHGTSSGRVTQVCEMIEQMWMGRQLTKIVTSDTIYTNMGITSIAIKKSHDLGYSREISLTAQQVRVTSKMTTTVPVYELKSGETEADAGKASTSKSSSKSSSKSGGSSGSSGSGKAASGSSDELPSFKDFLDGQIGSIAQQTSYSATGATAKKSSGSSGTGKKATSVLGVLYGKATGCTFK